MECEVCGQAGCEIEHEGIIVREGASLRTGDELAVVFIEDVCALLGIPEPTDLPAMEASTHSGSSHLADPDDTEVLTDFVREYEGKLGDAGYTVVWDDGYVVYKTEGD